MMAKVTVVVCDQCGSQESVTSYELKKGDKRIKADLCVQHGQPIEEAFKVGTTHRAPGRKRAAAPRTNVTTIEEIEKMKGGSRARKRA